LSEDGIATRNDDDVTVCDGGTGEEMVVWRPEGRPKEIYHEDVNVAGIRWCLQQSGGSRSGLVVLHALTMTTLSPSLLFVFFSFYFLLYFFFSFCFLSSVCVSVLFADLSVFFDVRFARKVIHG